MKDRVFSGIQPSGNLTIGNYLGALSNFSKQQDKYDCIYCVVDLHAITSGIDPKTLHERSFEIMALYLASGLDPNKSIIFYQSHVPAHAELMWALNVITPLGQLQRMTQFKAKSAKKDEIQAGLLNYPILMAGDIVLYDAKYVPVGDDQRQHIEFTRDLVEKFNGIYGETFIMPEMLEAKSGARIMSLQDPTSKMSKSDEDDKASIFILDEPKRIEKKIKSAVTDSLGNIDYNNEQLGLKNLINIYSAITLKSPEEIVSEYSGKGYGAFKGDLAQIVVEALRPIQENYKEIISDKGELERIYKDGADKANEIASKKLSEVYEKIGFVKK